MNSEKALEEAEIYLEICKDLLAKNPKRWNPAITNSIMAMIRTIDAGWIEFIGYTPKGGTRGHESTSNNLKKLYEDGYIATSFKANLDSVKKWVDQEKSRVQYKGVDYSKSDARKAYKGAKRLWKKMKKELGKT